MAATAFFLAIRRLPGWCTNPTEKNLPLKLVVYATIFSVLRAAFEINNTIAV
jgi:hypothetical protein